MPEPIAVRIPSPSVPLIVIKKTLAQGKKEPINATRIEMMAMVSIEIPVLGTSELTTPGPPVGGGGIGIPSSPLPWNFWSSVMQRTIWTFKFSRSHSYTDKHYFYIINLCWLTWSFRGVQFSIRVNLNHWWLFFDLVPTSHRHHTNSRVSPTTWNRNSCGHSPATRFRKSNQRPRSRTTESESIRWKLRSQQIHRQQVQTTNTLVRRRPPHKHLETWIQSMDPSIYLLLLILLELTQTRHAEQCRAAKNDEKDDWTKCEKQSFRHYSPFLPAKMKAPNARIDGTHTPT